MVLGVRGGHGGGTKGYFGVLGGTARYYGVLLGTEGYFWVLKGTRGGVLKGTAGSTADRLSQKKV